jgi:PAS domain S-box-containing protein
MTPSTPLVAYLSAGLTGCLLLAGVGLGRKYRWSSARELDKLALVIVGVSLWWSTVATIKFAATALSSKVLLYRLEMVAWIGLPTSTALFALVGFYLGENADTRPVRGLLAFLCALLAISVVLPQSVLIGTPRAVRVGTSVTLEHDFGVALGIVTGLAWATLLFSICMVVYRLARGRPVSPIIIAAVSIPLFPGSIALLKLFAVYPVGGDGFNLAPVANSLAVVVFALLVHQDGIQTIVPDSRHAAIENAVEGYLLADGRGIVLDLNDSAAHLTTTAVGDSVPPWLCEPFPGDSTETSVTTPTGRQVSVQRNTIGSAERQCTMFLIRDMTEQLRRMRELESRDLLITSIPVGVFRIELGAPPRIVYANDALADLFGLGDTDAVSGQPVARVFGSRELIDDTSIRSTAANPRPVEHEFVLPHDEPFWGLVSVYPSQEDETDMLEGVIMDITAEKQAEALLTEALSETTRDLDLIAQLWNLSVSFTGFDDFADATLSVVTATDMIHAAYVTRQGPASGPQPEFVAAAGDVQLRRNHLVEATNKAYDNEAIYTTTGEHEGTSYELIATPIIAENVVDSILIIVSESPVRKSLKRLADDVAAALAYKRTIAHRERISDDDRFVELQITVPNGRHPLTQILNRADVDTGPLSFTPTRVDEDMTWMLIQAQYDGCEAITSAAIAREASDAVSPTEVDDGQCRCEVAVETADIHHRLELEGVDVIDLSVDTWTTDICVHVPPAVDVATVVDIFRMEWSEARLRSRQVVEPEPVTPHAISELDAYQRKALEVAVRMGFFARPQGATTADVADALDTSRSTVTRRIRAGEKAVFSSLFTQSHNEAGGDPEGVEIPDSEKQ